MCSPVTLAIDGNGGDEIISKLPKALALAAKDKKDLHYLIFADKKLQAQLQLCGLKSSAYTFVATPLNIPQDENVLKVLRLYQDSSLYKAIRTVQQKKAQAVISSGGTGPLVCLARHLLGCMKLKSGHQLRPALIAKLPSATHPCTLMLDLGANATCFAQDLVDFAILGKIYANVALNLSNPSIGVLNVGTESFKGNHAVQTLKQYLIDNPNFNFHGFVESNKLLSTKAQILISDGFSGNIALKAAEGAVALFFKQNFIKSLCAYLACPSYLSSWHYNSSLLLGVQGLVIKSHASSDVNAIASSIDEAYALVKQDLVTKIANKLTQFSEKI